MSAVLTENGSTSVEFGGLDRVEWHLHNWARWMRTGQGVEGHAGRSAVLSTGGSSQSFDDMAEAEDRRCAKIVDAIIGDLPHPQRLAIYMDCGIARRVFRFARHTFDDALAAAKATLGRELAKRGVW